MKKNQYNPYDPDDVNIIPIEKPEEGMAKIIINTGDMITQYDTEMKDVIVRGEPDLVDNGDVMYCRNYRSYMPKLEELNPPVFQKSAELNINSGIFEYVDVCPAKGSKDLYVVRDNGYIEKANNPIIVGDDEYAYGLFIPFCASPDVMTFCARAFEATAQRSLEIQRNKYIKR